MKHTAEKKDLNKNAPVKPDPETLGPNPEEHMDGPVSSLVKKAGDAMEDNDKKDKPEEKQAE
jgi:hypothetical protein